MKTKYCPRCTVPQPIEFFNKNSAKKDGYQNYCRVHQGEYDREYYRKNWRRRDNVRKSAKKHLQRNREYAFNYLSNYFCIDCGEDDPIVLQFDHQDKKHKNIADMVRQGNSIDKIEKEIEKCDVRCANCHARKTAKDFGYYTYRMSN